MSSIVLRHHFHLSAGEPVACSISLLIKAAPILTERCMGTSSQLPGSSAQHVDEHMAAAGKD